MRTFTVNVYIIIITPGERNIKTSMTVLLSYQAVFKRSSYFIMLYSKSHSQIKSQRWTVKIAKL